MSLVQRRAVAKLMVRLAHAEYPDHKPLQDDCGLCRDHVAYKNACEVFPNLVPASLIPPGTKAVPLHEIPMSENFVVPGGNNEVS
jgi:hypothetical protein